MVFAPILSFNTQRLTYRHGKGIMMLVKDKKAKYHDPVYKLKKTSNLPIS
jgi:hypothetical protein